MLDGRFNVDVVDVACGLTSFVLATEDEKPVTADAAGVACDDFGEPAQAHQPSVPRYIENRDHVDGTADYVIVAARNYKEARLLPLAFWLLVVGHAMALVSGPNLLRALRVCGISDLLDVLIWKDLILFHVSVVETKEASVVDDNCGVLLKVDLILNAI